MELPMRTTLLLSSLCRGAAVLACALGLAAGAHAESFASSASSAGSASSGSVSDSIKNSSNSSSGDKKVADGDYRVIEVTALADRPDMLRLRLELAVPPAGRASPAFTLELPRQALGARGMGAGEIVRVRNREYGLAFARAQADEPFYLALEDDWHAQLASRLVTAD
jgi:hypothetical protein